MKIQSSLFATLVACYLLGTSCSNAQTKVATDTSASVPTSLKSTYEHSMLVDVRTPEEFAEGSVTGSVNIPLDEIPNRLNEFKDQKQIVVFCRSGNRSGKAKKILEDNGMTNVINGGSWEDVQEVLK